MYVICKCEKTIKQQSSCTHFLRHAPCCCSNNKYNMKKPAVLSSKYRLCLIYIFRWYRTYYQHVIRSSRQILRARNDYVIVDSPFIEIDSTVKSRQPATISAVCYLFYGIRCSLRWFMECESIVSTIVGASLFELLLIW